MLRDAGEWARGSPTRALVSVSLFYVAALLATLAALQDLTGTYDSQLVLSFFYTAALAFANRELMLQLGKAWRLSYFQLELLAIELVNFFTCWLRVRLFFLLKILCLLSVALAVARVIRTQQYYGQVKQIHRARANGS